MLGQLRLPARQLLRDRRREGPRAEFSRARIAVYNDCAMLGMARVKGEDEAVEVPSLTAAVSTNKRSIAVEPEVMASRSRRVLSPPPAAGC